MGRIWSTGWSSAGVPPARWAGGMPAGQPTVHCVQRWGGTQHMLFSGSELCLLRKIHHFHKTQYYGWDTCTWFPAGILPACRAGETPALHEAIILPTHGNLFGNKARTLRNPITARRGRDGRGVSSPRLQAGSHCSHQSSAYIFFSGSRPDAALRTGSTRGRGA